MIPSIVDIWLPALSHYKKRNDNRKNHLKSNLKLCFHDQSRLNPTLVQVNFLESLPITENDWGSSFDFALQVNPELSTGSEKRLSP